MLSSNCPTIKGFSIGSRCQAKHRSRRGGYCNPFGRELSRIFAKTCEGMISLLSWKRTIVSPVTPLRLDGLLRCLQQWIFAFAHGWGNVHFVTCAMSSDFPSLYWRYFARHTLPWACVHCARRSWRFCHDRGTVGRRPLNQQGINLPQYSRLYSTVLRTSVLVAEIPI